MGESVLDGKRRRGIPASTVENAPDKTDHRGIMATIGGVVSVVWLFIVISRISAMLPDAVMVAFMVLAISIVPGFPLAAWVTTRSAVTDYSLGIGLSWALHVFVAQATVLGSGWHVRGASVAMATVGLLSALAVLIRLAVNPGQRRWMFPQLRSSTKLPVTTADWFKAVGLVAALSTATILFLLAARQLDTSAVSSTGLFPLLHWTYFVSIAIVCALIGYQLTRPRVSHSAIALSLAFLIAFFTQIVSYSDRAVAFPNAFVHRGLIEVIRNIEGLPPPSDARFDWAGFFSVFAVYSDALNIDDFNSLLIIAPLIFDLAMIGPIWVIGRVLSGSERIAWLGATLYPLFNWYQQDYFSPQATALFWMTLIVALLLTDLRMATLPIRARLSRPSSWWRLPGRVPSRPLGASAAQVLSLELSVIVIGAAMVMTHQITPIVLVVALLAFTAFGVSRARVAWLVVGVSFALWFSFGAVGYWSGHLVQLIGDVGQVSSSVAGGLQDRFGGDPAYQRMQLVRVATTGGFLLLAFYGWFRLRFDRTALITAALVVIPFGLVAVQSYGGEIIIRSVVLGTPITAPLAALGVGGLWRICTRKISVLRLGSLASMLVVSAVLFCFALALTQNRGLNTAFEHTTAVQAEVANKTLEQLPAGSRIMTWGAASSFSSGRMFVDVDIRRVDSLECLDELVECTIEIDPNYVVAVDQARWMLRMQYGIDSVYLDDKYDELVATGKYLEMYSNHGIKIARRSDMKFLEVEP